MKPKAKGQVGPGVGTGDIDGVGVFEDRRIPIPGDVPHENLVVLFDLLAPELAVGVGRAAHIGQGRLPADDLRHHVRNKTRISLELGELLRELVKAVDAPRHGVSGGVIAAHNQEHEVAQELHGLHVFGFFAVGQHGDEVVPGLALALLPKGGEGGQALQELISALLDGIDDAPARNGGNHIGPAGELPALLEGEVEEAGEHHGGELNGYRIDPIEGGVLRQAIEHGSGAAANEPFHLGEVRRRDHPGDGFPLHVVHRRILGDEHADLQRPFGQGGIYREAQGNALRRGKVLPVDVDLLDVLIAGERPETPGQLRLIEVHRVLGSQALEGFLPAVFREKPRIRRVHVLQGNVVGRRQGAIDEGFGVPGNAGLVRGCCNAGLRHEASSAILLNLKQRPS